MIMNHYQWSVERIAKDISQDVCDADVCNTCKPLQEIVGKLLDEYELTGDCPPDVAFQFDDDIAHAVAKMVVGMALFQSL